MTSSKTLSLDPSRTRRALALHVEPLGEGARERLSRTESGGAFRVRTLAGASNDGGPIAMLPVVLRLKVTPATSRRCRYENSHREPHYVIEDCCQQYATLHVTN